jgi:uncharacterized surface protein with fasciclin (FAS1) repeats
MPIAMRLFRFSAAVLSIAAAASLAAADHHMKNPIVGGKEMFPTKNIIQNAVNSADHTTLVAAVKAAGLVETLQGAGPFTVFAPTDEAFAKLPAGTLEALLKPENKPKLQRILTSHVVAGRIMAADVVKTSSAKSVSGDTLTIASRDGGVTVGGAKVVKTDIAATNGVIHVIDSVILPKDE